MKCIIEENNKSQSRNKDNQGNSIKMTLLKSVLKLKKKTIHSGATCVYILVYAKGDKLFFNDTYIDKAKFYLWFCNDSDNISDIYVYVLHLICALKKFHK